MSVNTEYTIELTIFGIWNPIPRAYMNRYEIGPVTIIGAQQIIAEMMNLPDLILKSGIPTRNIKQIITMDPRGDTIRYEMV